MGNSALTAIRARLAAAEQNNNKTFDNTTFAFWNADNNSTSAVRFVPDGDPDNIYFWVEKLQIKLPFNGISGGESKPITVNVPCVEMFPRNEYPGGCPILSEVRAWYKDPSMTQLANKYWKKASYILQGFVRDSAVKDDKAPENPILRFSLNKQLFNLVKAGLMDPEMLNTPTDFDNGTDFRIVKTQKGQYADYGTSSYARRESALTQTELDAVEKYKLNNLSEFLGKKPTDEDLKIIKEMFEASVDGQAYDTEKWGKFYRPAGLKNENDSKESTSESKQESVSNEKTESPVETVTEPVSQPTTSTKYSAEKILADIRARQANKK